MSQFAPSSDIYAFHQDQENPSSNNTQIQVFAFLSHGGDGSEVGTKFSGRDVICLQEKILLQAYIIVYYAQGADEVCEGELKLVLEKR